MLRVLRWLIYTLMFFVVVLIGAYAAGQYYKPTILEKINSELKNSVNGDVQIGSLDFTIFEHFPNVSITLGDIYVRGPHYDQYKKDVLTAEKVYVHIDPRRIIDGAVNLKSISVRNGNIFIFRDSKGFTNMDVIKKREKPDTLKSKRPAPSLELENILLENMRLTYVDTLKHKSYDVQFLKTTALISESDSSKQVILDGEMFFGGITFNTEKGGYMSQTKTQATLRVEFIPEKQKLIVNPSTLQFAKSTVALTGEFDFKAPGRFTLAISSRGLNYQEGLTLVTRALSEKLSTYQFEGPIDLSVNLVGLLAPGDEPRIDIAFYSEANNFTTGKLSVKDLTFKGSFTNHLDEAKPMDDRNSRILLDSVSGKLEAINVKAALSISDLIHPVLKMKSKSTMRLVDFNHETDTSKLKLLGGTLAAFIDYDGPLMEYLDGPKSQYKGHLKGAIQIREGALSMRSEQKNFKKINAQMRFTEKRMDFDKIDFIVNGNVAQLKGSVVGFIPFFLIPQGKGIIDLSLYSPRLDLATLSTPRKEAATEVKSDPKESKKKISHLLDVLNEKMEFNVRIKSDEIINGNFEATKFDGKIMLADNQLVANPVRMVLADGIVDFSLKVSNLDKTINPVVLNAEVSGADIKKFFSSFNNFSQKTIVADNLSGKIHTKINLTAKIDDKFNVLMPSLNGEVEFKLKEGKLKDFEPLQNMSNFLLKKRDFNDVQFAEIKGTFHIAGQYLDVSRMEIESTVLSLFLEGRYSLGDSTDLSIQVPLSNLKRRDRTYKPENVGVDAKVGPSIFLRARQNKEGKMTIAYNIFKKFKKK